MIILFEPVFKDKVWGGNKLKELFNYDVGDRCGEAWGFSGREEGSSIALNSIYKGKTLYELYRDHPELFGNYESNEFPILVKLIDAKDNLSIKVNPDHEYAQKKHQSQGKDECWYVVDAHPNTDMIIGHNATSKEEIKYHIVNNNLTKILNKFKIKTGDFFYIEAGTIHGICKNTVILEVQQPTHLAYRIYDYKRKRQLHIEDALEVLNVPDSGVIEIPRNTHFSFDIIKNFSPNTHTSSKHGDYIFILNGSGQINNTFVKKGDFIMVTSLSEYKIEGKLTYQITKF